MARNRGAKAGDQRSFFEGLAKIALHALAEHALLVEIIWIGGDQDGRNPEAAAHQVSVKLHPRHVRHVNVRHQAMGRSQSWRCQKFRRGREWRDGVAHGLYQPAQGITKRLIIVDNRDQRIFGHRRSTIVQRVLWQG